MPFLTKKILIKILTTYPGGDQLEARYNSILSDCNGEPASYYETVRDALKKGSSKVLNSSLGWFGFNTAEDSEACWFEIRALIDDAIKNKNLNAWTDILCTAGEGGFHRHIKSARQSRFCQTSYALLVYMRNKIEKTAAIIAEREGITNLDSMILAHDQIKRDHEKSKRKSPAPITEFEKLLASIPDEEDQLALKVYATVCIRKEVTRQFVIQATENIKRSLTLKLSSVYSNKLETNVSEGQVFHDSSLKMIEIAQRQLIFLGEDPLKEDTYIKSAQAIFKGLPYYDDHIRTRYKLTTEQVGSIKFYLPLYLQKIYFALYIRDHRKDLASVVDEDKVVESFESVEQIIGGQDSSRSVDKDKKAVSAAPKTATPAPRTTPVPAIPDRAAVTKLKTPVIPERKIEDKQLTTDVKEQESESFGFGDAVSSDKFRELFLSSPVQASALVDRDQAEPAVESDAAQSPVMDAAALSQQTQATARKQQALDHKHSKPTQPAASEKPADVSQSQANENGFFETVRKKKHNKGSVAQPEPRRRSHH